jgi:hypothetical protein
MPPETGATVGDGFRFRGVRVLAGPGHPDLLVERGWRNSGCAMLR